MLNSYTQAIKDYIKAAKIWWRAESDSTEAGELFTNIQDSRAQGIALNRLRRIRLVNSIDQLCAVWHSTRHAALAKLITDYGWVATTPPEIRLLTALLTQKPEYVNRDWANFFQGLVEVSAKEQDLTLARRAGDWLEQRYGLDQLLELRDYWQKEWNEDITDWLGFIGRNKAGMRVLVALKVGRPELLAECGEQVVMPLLESANSYLKEHSHNALLGLRNTAAQELLCKLALEPGNTLALDITLAAGFAPREEHPRALFYFLTQQWGKYEGLDFDQRLMRFVYEAADNDLRQQIAATAQRAGRSELVSIMSGGRQGLRARSMSDPEWQLVLELLQKGQRWEEAWQLAQVAPPVWSRKLLLELIEHKFKPEGEQVLYTELAVLALECTTEYPPLGRQLKAKMELKGHTGEVHTLAIIPDGKTLATGGEDGTIRLWSLPEGKLLAALRDELRADDKPRSRNDNLNQRVAITSLAFSPDGQTLAFEEGRNLSNNNWGGRLRLLQLGETISVVTLQSHATPTKHGSVAFHPDKQILASCCGDEVFLWNLANNQVFKKLRVTGTWYRLGRFELESVAFSPDGKWLAGGCSNGRIMLWGLENGQYTPSVINEGGYPIFFRCLAFSPDSKILAGGNIRRHVKLWSVPDGNGLPIVRGHYNELKTLAFSPDGTRLATGHREAVRLWATPEGYQNLTGTWQTPQTRPVKTMKKHQGAINALAFSPDGKLLVSVGEDSKILLWSSRLSEVAHISTEQANIKDLVFARQSQRDPALPANERAWLAFIEALLGWKWQHEIEIEDFSNVQAGIYDIEF